MQESSRVPLFLISFAALFFEVLTIRWVSTEILVFGYFKNLILMGAFVGLGLGCAGGASRVSSSSAASGQSPPADGLIPILPYLLLLMVLLLSFASSLGLAGINFVLSSDVFFWLGRSDVVSSVEQVLFNALKVIGVFLLIVSIFDGLGQILGRELAKHPPLSAYTANLGGSLAGVLVYSLLAFAKTGPFIWLLAFFPSLLVFYKRPWHWAAMAACVVIAGYATNAATWSQYYRIETAPYIAKPVSSVDAQDLQHQLYVQSKDPQAKPYQIGTHVMVNRASFQRTINLSDAFLAQHPELRQTSEYATYNIPYEARSGRLDDVLVLGAGSGNDVAAALRHGAQHVDAVEIDGSIVQVGKQYHPEEPYQNPRVTVFVNDARNYLASHDKKYDVIAFGFVDSTVSFSMLSSVRLDNFLYTKESLTLVNSRLKSDGLAVLSFAAGPDWLRARLYQLVQASSGQEPVALHSTTANPNSIVLIWGPGLTAAVRQRLLDRYSALLVPKSVLNIPTPLCYDDWPFLYQREHTITSAYMIMLCLLLSIAGSATVARFRLNMGSFFRQGQFFLLGAGFLLLETRAMLVTAALFGSTWIVNSIVIALILLMALMANFMVSRFRTLNQYWAYAALFVSLIVLYAVPLSSLTGAPLVIKLGAASLIVGAPFACAGLVFSSAYAKTNEPDKALGINIFGALLGGCLEYCSLIIGTRDLVLVALALYALSLGAAQVLKGKDTQ